MEDADIEIIQKNSYSPANKIELFLHRENQDREEVSLPKNQLLASMLATYQKEHSQNQSKAPRKRILIEN